MKWFILLTIAWYGLAPAVFAHEAHEDAAAPESQSQFELENNLVENIFKQSTDEHSIVTTRATANLSVEATLSYLSPNDLSLSNQYFEIGYGEGFSGIPSFQLNVSSPLSTWKYGQLLVLGRVGYGRKEALTSVKSASGGSFKDMLQINWLPLAAGLRGQLFPGANPIVRPFAELAGGVQWLYQSGKLDKALEQGYWIPFWRASLGTTFFGSTNTAVDWFGGVVASVSLYRSFSSAQRMNGWSADLGLSILL